MGNAIKIAVIMPTFKVKRYILEVISQIGPEVDRIYIVDDCCPDNSGDFVRNNCTDSRVVILCHSYNKGVGGAVMTGYKAGIEDGYDILVKVDSDGQMNPLLIPTFIKPIISGDADYTKGNRFFDLEKLSSMPTIRLFGNAILSLLTKLSSGYWDLFDPTNGFTAIHRNVAKHLPFNKISHRYFFETDMLFRLNILRAVVVDIPMDAKYGDEISNMKISKVIFEFLYKHFKNFCKRIFYNYYLRDMSIASIELPIGFLLMLFGLFFGGFHWLYSAHSGVLTPVGTVMLSAIPVIIGIQFILAFLAYDIASVPRHIMHSKLF